MSNDSFGKTLRTLREQKKLSVKEVIEKLKNYGENITDKTLYSYEADKRAASADMLLALCQIYGCKNILETFAGFEPDYSIPDDAEWKVIEKYRALDSHGKEMVDFTLLKEWERSIADQEAKNKVIQMAIKEDVNYVNAAHTIEDASEEDKQFDEDIMHSDTF